MSKLLSSNFIRLKKDKSFWLGILFMFAVGIYFPLMRFIDAKESNVINNIDNGFFACALFIGIVMAVFCSLFIGTEYSDGTIRNKIIIGHKRTSIYLANFVTASIVSAAMCIAFFLPYLCIGIPLLGFFEMDIKIVLLLALAVFLLAVAFTSIFVLIAMLNHNKAVTAVFCILLSLGISLTGTMLNRMLEAPETLPSYSVAENGDMYTSEVENPRYLKGEMREFIQTLYDIIPGGQAIQCCIVEVVNLPLLPIYSLGIVILTTGIGLVFFKKKELK